MRTVHDDAAVRLYHLDGETGAATTLTYGALVDALVVAAAQPETMQAELFVQTQDDVVPYLDLAGR